MKTLAILFFSILMLTSCKHQNSFETTPKKVEQVTTTTTARQFALPPAPGDRTYPMAQHDVRDENGLTVYSYLYPSNWKQEDHDPDVFLINEHDAKVFHEVSLGNYAFYKDEQINGRLKKEGHAISEVKSFDQIIDETIRPITDSLHITLEPLYEVSQIAQRQQEFYDHFINLSRPNNSKFESMILEGMDTLNIKSIVVITRVIHEFDDETSWSVNAIGMEAPIAFFEEAKVDFLKSVTTSLFGYEYIYRYNQNAIQAITNNYTHQYFTPRERFIRQHKITAEQSRTGCSSYQSMQKYVQEIASKNWKRGDFKDIPVDYSKVPKNINPYGNHEDYLKNLDTIDDN